MVIILVALTILAVLLVQAILHRSARKIEVPRAELERGLRVVSPVAAVPVRKGAPVSRRCLLSQWTCLDET